MSKTKTIKKTSTPQRTLILESTKMVGKEITIKGWVDSKRDHGKVTFVDLRDRTAKVQCVGVGKMGELTTESVIEITGLVKERPERLINKKLATGTVEIEVLSYIVLNATKELPITINTDGKEIAEQVRLKYRYLDLRRSRMQDIFKLRSKMIDALRQELFKDEFVEIETPMLTKSTKEGSRDFVVPSRFQPGKFYALPQSPQQYKQLLMTAGFENYFQIARCIRDEDLRADRGFEFTQIDLEMSFVTQQDVMDKVEDMVKGVATKLGGKLKDQNFPVVTYQDAMDKYGADRFDMRTEEEKEAGVLAFAWVVDFPFFKKVDKDDVAEVRDGKSGWTFTHNPFSAPQPEYLENHMAGKDIENILTAQYDLVCNGYEIGGGSVRAHQPEVLKKTFEIMGYNEAETEESIGHMLRAFELGTPPHGGIALGLDRLVMILANETSLKETVAFPMTSTGRTSVMDAPNYLSEDQLSELGIDVKIGDGLSPHDYILQKLQQAGASYEYISHEPVFTSEEAAEIRGGKLSEGAKALVLEIDKEYVVLTLPGDQRADLKGLKKQLGAKKVSMASRDSVKSKTGLEVGSIPPFGSSMGLKTYADKRLAENEKIAFNVGKHNKSVVMKYEDFVKVEKPTMV